MQDDIQEVKRKSFQYLRHLHEAVEGNENRVADMEQVGGDLGFSAGEAERIVNYLLGEEFVYLPGLGGEVGITASGIAEVGRSFKSK